MVPRSRLAKQAMMGVGASAGGILLLALPVSGVLSFVVGGVLLVAGLALATAKSDRTSGVVAAAVGGAAILGGILPGRNDVVSTLVRIAGWLGLGGGIYMLVRFFLNLRKRS
jgi:hypothetical protein